MHFPLSIADEFDIISNIMAWYAQGGVFLEFSGFLGNTDLKQRLSSSFRGEKVSHCYLLCGPDGSGKRTLARILSAALQCEGASVPCGRCAACRKVFAGIHPDVITIDDPDKKTVSVELIRQLQADAYVRPNEGKKKIYCIPRAQDMTDSAQNALLKLIEEPPSYAVFFLLTNNAEKLLPTVRSRSAELRLEPIPWEQALTWLRGKFPEAEPASLQAAYARSGGYLGQAELLLQGGLQLPQTEAFAAAWQTGDRYALTHLLCSMEKLPRDKLLEIFLQWKQLLADALLVRAGFPGGPEATALARQRTAAQLAEAAGAVQTAMDHCAANVGAGHICGWLTAVLPR